MDDHISMSISVDSPLDGTVKRGPLVLFLGRQYEFPFEQFSFFSDVDKLEEFDISYFCFVFLVEILSLNCSQRF